ncbi:chemotaxis protein [Geomonas sp. Red276]
MTAALNEDFVTTAPGREAAGLAVQWAQVLAGVVEELGVISRSTEDEFLAIGARLQDIYQQGTGISKLATGVVEEVAGGKVTNSMAELGRALDEMERYVNRAGEEIGASSDTLREILTLLEQVATPLSGFKKVNKVLRMLGISTKIESARLGQSAAGFDTLASDVGHLSVQVNERAADIIRRKDDLSLAIGETLKGVLSSGAHQHDRVLAIVKKTRSCLDTLTAINSRCSNSVAGVSAISEEVSRGIGEVVMSMQAHDIVRQQIEHVEQALGDLRSGVQSGLAGADDAACICELQSAQLKHASSSLDQAANTIIGTLQDIARKQGTLSAEISGLAGAADQAGGSFFKGMAGDMSVVNEALLESAQAKRSLCNAMTSVADTIQEIASFVGDIETIGEEIKLIALNAQIKSAYTGDEGAALGVLAEAIQRLSIDAINQTGAVSEVLQSIIAVTERLSQEACGLDMEVEGMVTTLNTLVGVLSEVNETLRGSLAGMDSQAALLCDEIEQVTSGFTVHHKVTQVLDRAVQKLGEVIREARRIAPGTGQVSLEALAERYTMQSERHIHQSLVDQAPASPEPASAGGDDGLGDNVELF